MLFFPVRRSWAQEDPRHTDSQIPPGLDLLHDTLSLGHHGPLPTHSSRDKQLNREPQEHHAPNIDAAPPYPTPPHTIARGTQRNPTGITPPFISAQPLKRTPYSQELMKLQTGLQQISTKAAAIFASWQTKNKIIQPRTKRNS